MLKFWIIFQIIIVCVCMWLGFSIWFYYVFSLICWRLWRPDSVLCLMMMGVPHRNISLNLRLWLFGCCKKIWNHLQMCSVFWRPVKQQNNLNEIMEITDYKLTLFSSFFCLSLELKIFKLKLSCLLNWRALGCLDKKNTLSKSVWTKRNENFTFFFT